MKRINLLIFLPLLLLSNDDLIEKANELEQQGKYKEALQIYKELNQKNIKQEDSFTKVKEENFKSFNKIEDEETMNTMKQSFIGDFDLHPYKKTYIMPITYDSKDNGDRKDIETQFQFSLEKPLIYI